MFGKSKKERQKANGLAVHKKSKQSQKVIGLEVIKNVIRMTVIHGNDIIYGEKLLEGTIIKRDKLRNAEELSDALRILAKELGVAGSHVVYHLNNQTVLIQELKNVSDKSEKQIRETLFLELGDSISLPFTTPIFELLIASTPEKPKKKVKKKAKKTSKRRGKQPVEPEDVAVLDMIEAEEDSKSLVNKDDAVTYIVTSEDLLVELADCILRAGLKPAAVDFSALAVTRYFEDKIDFTQSFMLIELSSGTATMTIFEGEVPIYVQYEDYNSVGWRYFLEDEALTSFFNEERERSELRKLVMLIEQLTYYYQTNLSDNQELQAIYITGEHPWIDNEFNALLMDDLQYPIRILQFPHGFAAKYILSVGLAMKEV